jgi:hypothetical protein
MKINRITSKSQKMLAPSWDGREELPGLWGGFSCVARSDGRLDVLEVLCIVAPYEAYEWKI